MAGQEFPEGAQTRAMTPEERAVLERRIGVEARGSRLMLGMHLVFVIMLAGMARLETSAGARRAILFVAGFIAVCGGAWLLWLSGFFRRLDEDRRSGLVASGRALVAKKYIATRKASPLHVLVVDPPMPDKELIVSAPAYAAVEKGDLVVIVYYPRSRALCAVGKAPE